MTSKEALKDISYLILQEVDNLKYKDLWKEALNTIKQDLERFEVLEKENIELQLQLEQLEDSAKIRMQQADEYATILKEKYLDLKQENEKLKKVIKIIKRMDIFLNQDEDFKDGSIEICGYLEVSEEVFDLLKVVIINE